MAINEQIVTGRKFRKLVDEATKLWQRISFWTKAVDVEFNDSKTAETKLGAIDGITDSLVSTSSRIAASAKALSQVNNNLSGCRFTVEGSGADTKYYVQNGADAASKKLLGSGKLKLLASGINFGTVGSGSASSAVKEISADVNNCSVLVFCLQSGNVDAADDHFTANVGATIIVDKDYLKEHHSASYLMSNYYWSGGAAINAYLKYNSEKSLSAYFQKIGNSSTSLPIQYGYLYGI